MGADVPSRADVAGRVAEADAAIQRQLTDLMDRIVRLSACSAETTASFHVLRSRWQDDAGRFHAAMADIGAAVGGAR